MEDLFEEGLVPDVCERCGREVTPTLDSYAWVCAEVARCAISEGVSSDIVGLIFRPYEELRAMTVKLHPLICESRPRIVEDDSDQSPASQNVASNGDGLVELTPEQHEVAVDLVTLGGSNKEMASRQHRSVSTVKYHIEHLGDLLDVGRGKGRKAKIAVELVRRGLLQGEEDPERGGHAPGLNGSDALAPTGHRARDETGHLAGSPSPGPLSGSLGSDGGEVVE